MSKFKIKDKIRTKGDGFSFDPAIGEIVKVKSGNFYRVKIRGQKGLWNYWGRELELIKKKER